MTIPAMPPYHPDSLLDISTPDVFPGSGSFTFDRGRIASRKPVPVHFHLPRNLPEDAPVVFVMHGTKRDAKNYRDNWRAAAERFGFVLLCPEFRKDIYNRRAYHLGYVTYRSGKPRNPAKRTFAVIEDIFDFVLETTGKTNSFYDIYGHSAGAQFVHRMVMFAPESRFATAVAANSGWYTMPDSSLEYPYGIRDLGLTDEMISTSFGESLTILLGENDTDPDDPYLRNSPETAGQGANRFERGHNFYEEARSIAGGLQTQLRWKLQTAPDAPHLDSEMMPYAIRAIFGNPPLVNPPSYR